MNEIARLPAGVRVFERGWLSANNILLTGLHGTALVDSGYCTHAAQTVGLVEKALGGRPLDVLINTHLHSDHCGGNSGLQASYPELKTFIPPGQASLVADWNPMALTYEPTGQSCPQFRFDGTLIPGSTICLGDQGWQVLAAPGHDAHSVILFEEGSRTLISADALWEVGFGVVFQELEGIDAFHEVAATLDLIESLRPNLVIPGHGRVFSGTHEALAHARRRLVAYRNDPARHATHAAKVLLKFRLLEVQRIPLPDLIGWAQDTIYLQIVFTRYFGNLRFESWIESLVADLQRSGAARVANGVAENT
ncbi:MBL fold metallo-hydrolase [Caenimonas sp. SL110]|uniref:MBL fold metallo-hydrolase n=1 Tax=Caenimonas sp. SL110 TaxID=1450524 RepID=UPI000653EDE2|nr:MBL fold metallo-hydrolase [Caenimonas sp. SL110]